jgi:hypothetical protein
MNYDLERRRCVAGLPEDKLVPADGARLTPARGFIAPAFDLPLGGNPGWMTELDRARRRARAPDRDGDQRRDDPRSAHADRGRA